MTVVNADDAKVFYDFRRAMAKAYPKLSRTNKAKGGSLLFRRGAYSWYDLFLFYLLEHT